MISNMHGEPWDDGFKDEAELKAACKKLKIEYINGYKKRYGFAPGLNPVITNTVIKSIVKCYTASCVPHIEAMLAAFFADDGFLVRGHSILVLKNTANEYFNECRGVSLGKTKITPHNKNRVLAIREALGIKEIRDYDAGVDANGRLIR